jgi:HK97 gp10 family phage protein
MGIQLNGLEGIVERLETYNDAQKFEAQLKKACALVERAAKEKAPKGTGELRRSITSEIKQEGDNLLGVVFTPLEYAPYVEFGTGLFAEDGGRTDVPWRYQDDRGEWHTTSGQHPQPFMRPAVDENREEILRILREALKND